MSALDLAIPGDVNDIPIVSRLGPPMTTVRVPSDEIAVAALGLLNHGPDWDQGRNPGGDANTDPAAVNCHAEIPVVPRLADGPVRG